MNKQTTRPLVLSFEGGEGSGKTTVINHVKAYFQRKNIDFLVTREPGGVPISERIREVILDKGTSEMDSRTEALLFAAARRQHLVQKVQPALKQGNVVIFDRFVDSSMVYQGYVRGIGIDEVYQMNLFATEGFLPDLTIYLDLDPEIGLHRIMKDPDREINKIDLESSDFHFKVREGYLKLCELYSSRIIKVDASKDVETVLNAVIKEIEVYLQR